MSLAWLLLTLILLDSRRRSRRQSLLVALTLTLRGSDSSFALAQRNGATLRLEPFRHFQVQAAPPAAAAARADVVRRSPEGPQTTYEARPAWHEDPETDTPEHQRLHIDSKATSI